MSRIHQALNTLNNLSGDFVGVGSTIDGRRIALYAETRSVHSAQQVCSRPLVDVTHVGMHYDGHPSIRVVNGLIAVGNGKHIDVLVDSLVKCRKPSPLRSFAYWDTLQKFASPKTDNEMSAELNQFEQHYTARVGGVITDHDAAMMVITTNAGNREYVTVRGPSEGKIRIIGNYTNNMITPGDYLELPVHARASVLAEQLSKEFPPQRARRRHISLLYYDLRERRGELVQTRASKP